MGRRIEQVGWLGWGEGGQDRGEFDAFSRLGLVMAVGVYFISVHFV